MRTNLVLALAALAQDTRYSGQSETAFRMTILGDVSQDLQIPGGGPLNQAVATRTEIDYVRRRDGRQLKTIIRRFLVHAEMNGEILGHMEMAAGGISVLEGKKIKSIATTELPPPLKEMFDDIFDQALYKAEIDGDGRELNTVPSQKAGAQSFIANGMVENTRLLHPPFPDKQERWEAPARMSMGNGNYVTGRLTYEKVKGEGGLQEVKGVGTLTAEVVRMGLLKLTQVKYVVTLTLFWNSEKNEWVKGSGQVQASYLLEGPDNLSGKAAGKLEVLLGEP